MSAADRSYVSRAGMKLEHALRAFEIDPRSLICADFGCNVGGFTDCLLQHGAARVHAIDTGYGILDWRLRNDPRVIVMERTNALHAFPPESAAEGDGSAGTSSGKCDLIVIDLGWTKQQRAVPAAVRWLKPQGRIITLIKPHYEASDEEKAAHMSGGTLSDDAAHSVAQRVLNEMPSLGVDVITSTPSPLRGSKSSRRSRDGGNVEFLALLRPKT